MKRSTIIARDEDGNAYRWFFWREPQSINVCIGKRPRKSPMWMYTDHEGYTRCAGETWSESVDAILLTLDNYGLTARLS